MTTNLFPFKCIHTRETLLGNTFSKIWIYFSCIRLKCYVNIIFVLTSIDFPYRILPDTLDVVRSGVIYHLLVRNVYPRTHIFQHFIFIFVCSALNVVTFPILYAAWLCNDKSDMVCRRIKAYKVIHKLISDFIWAVDMLLPYFLLGGWKIYNCCWYMLLLKISFRIFVTSCLFRNNIIKMYGIGMTELYLWLWVLVCNNFDRRHYFKIIEVSTYIVM